jgi:hypothetical protein
VSTGGIQPWDSSMAWSQSEKAAFLRYFINEINIWRRNTCNTMIEGLKELWYQDVFDANYYIH